jgi:hypothetical protein
VAWACINFLRAKIHTAGFKQTDWGYSSSPILSFRQSGDVPRRIGDWPAGHLDALDLEVHAAIPTVGLLIAVTLPPAIAVHRLATVSRLLPPRSGLSRSDLVRWHITSMSGSIVMAAIEGNRNTPAKSGRQPPVRCSAKAQAVADLPSGARRGLQHHRGTANE